MTPKQVARNIMDAEWENINMFHGCELIDYLHETVDSITDEDCKSLWMEFYGITNDPIMGAHQ